MSKLQTMRIRQYRRIKRSEARALRHAVHRLMRHGNRMPDNALDALMDLALRVEDVRDELSVRRWGR